MRERTRPVPGLTRSECAKPVSQSEHGEKEKTGEKKKRDIKPNRLRTLVLGVVLLVRCLGTLCGQLTSVKKQHVAILGDREATSEGFRFQRGRPHGSSTLPIRTTFNVWRCDGQAHSTIRRTAWHCASNAHQGAPRVHLNLAGRSHSSLLVSRAE